MASKDSTLEALLWLTPVAKDLLRTISKTLRGAVPCPATQLATALGETADTSEGLLISADVRKALCKELQGLGSEVSDMTAPAIVDILGKVLLKEVEAIKKKAAGVKGKLPKQKKGEPMAGYKELAPLAQKDQMQTLSNDSLVWHSVANGHDSKTLTAPPDEVFTERASLAACCPDGPVGEVALALHVLENLAAYIKWELSLPGSKPPSAGIEVKRPFDDKQVNEVAIRRCLTMVLAPEVAMAVIAEAGGNASKVSAALQKLAGDARKQAIIPMYSAPQAPKDPKDKKKKADDAGEGAGGAKKGKKGEDAGAKTAPVAAPAAGSFDALHAATATQELQWHLLAYRLDPGTTLSRTMTGSASAGGAKVSAGAVSAVAAGPKPQGFQGIWQAGQGMEYPPGHTNVSWSTTMSGQDKNFQAIWGGNGQTPPGHTAVSFGNATSSAPAAATAAAPPAAKAAKPAAAQAKSPAAKPATAPAAPAAAASGPADEAAIKAVGDEIRILKEKLKGEGVTGKKLNEHPEIAKLVGKLTEMKSGGAGAAAAPAPAKSAAAPAPAASTGAGDEAAIKAVGDDLRALKEKLKSEGVTGKKLNDHAEVVALVGKLSELKKGGK